jgi:hypothetical protein
MKMRESAWAVWAALLVGLFAAATASGSTGKVVLIEDFDDTS